MRNNGDIGLVLSGGGAKGAFQAGVWKAMCEIGLSNRVRAISGTSVGAINAAAFATIQDPNEICRFWRERVEEVATPNLRNLSIDSFRRAAENVLAGKSFPFRGLLDRGALDNLVRSLMPEVWPKEAPPVIATSLECRGGLLEELNPDSYGIRRFRIDEEPDAARRVSMVLASAAIPWGFEPVEIDGCRFVDGGWDEKGGENIPVTPFLENGYSIGTLVIVRCNSREVEPEPLRLHLPHDMRVVEICPQSTLRGLFDGLSDFVPDSDFMRNLPFLGTLADNLDAIGKQLRIWSGTFAFDAACAERFVRQGYADGMAELRCLRPKATLNW